MAWKIIALIIFFSLPSSLTFPASVSNNFPSVTTSIEVAHNTTILLRCHGRVPYPLWYVNESLAESPQYAVRNPRENEFVGELTISGNATCGILDLRCKEHNSTVYIISSRLTVQGPLPPPENVHISEHFNSSIIEWKPPYSAMNNASDIIHVYPHITHYTVYITDNYTGNIIIKENVTETRFTFNMQNDSLCPTYQLSARNAGGEGELSEPVQDRIPRVPRKVAAGNVSYAVTSQVLHIHLNVTDSCEMKIPNFFNITVMTSDRVVIKTVQHDYQSRSQVRIELPQNVDMCSLHVNISAGNSAGMSSPTEIEVECPTIIITDSLDNTPTTSTQAVATTVDISDKPQQANNITTLVAVVVGAAAVGLVILAVSVLITVWKCKRKVKVQTTEKNLYVESGQNIQDRTQISVSERSSPQSSADGVDSQTALVPKSTGINNTSIQEATSMSSVDISLRSTATMHPCQNSSCVYTS